MKIQAVTMKSLEQDLVLVQKVRQVDLDLDLSMKAGKKRQIPANRVSSKSRSRSSSKKQKTSGKTKNCREGNDT